MTWSSLDALPSFTSGDKRVCVDGRQWMSLDRARRPWRPAALILPPQGDARQKRVHEGRWCSIQARQSSGKWNVEVSREVAANCCIASARAAASRIHGNDLTLLVCFLR
jgi:hypothetical protein